MSSSPNVEAVKKSPSKAWYLLPIFVGIIGGLVMYFVLKNTDRKMAKRGLILSVILTAAGFAISIIANLSLGMDSNFMN